MRDVNGRESACYSRPLCSGVFVLMQRAWRGREGECGVGRAVDVEVSVGGWGRACITASRDCMYKAEVAWRRRERFIGGWRQACEGLERL